LQKKNLREGFNNSNYLDTLSHKDIFSLLSCGIFNYYNIFNFDLLFYFSFENKLENKNNKIPKDNHIHNDIPKKDNQDNHEIANKKRSHNAMLEETKKINNDRIILKGNFIYFQ